MIQKVIAMCTLAVLSSVDESLSQDPLQAIRWDYVKNPVGVNDLSGSPAWHIGLAAFGAFDGYGAQGSQGGCARAWHLVGLPTDTKPFACEIDYGVAKDIAVSAFVNYCYVPDGRDLRFCWPGPSAFKSVRISAKSDGENWAEIALLKDLPPGCPQVLPVNATKPARFWKIEVLELAAGAGGLMSYEIDTYTGGMPSAEQVAPEALSFPDLPAAFATRVMKHEPESGAIKSKRELTPDGQALAVTFETNGKTCQGEVAVLVGEQRCTFSPNGEESYVADVPGGTILLKTHSAPIGSVLELSYSAKADNPVKYLQASLQLTTPDCRLCYVPAYVWSARTGEHDGQQLQRADPPCRLG